MLATEPRATEAPYYSTQAVANATGIPVTTILAWERRYGVPRPRRGDGGRRLYSAEDVALLRAMRLHTAQGVRAEVAARALRDPDAASRPLHPAALATLPTDVQEVHCLHCGTTSGDLLLQRTPDGVQTRFVLAPGAVPPRRGPGGRARCGRCGGDLYREPVEQRPLPPLAQMAGAPRARGAA